MIYCWWYSESRHSVMYRDTSMKMMDDVGESGLGGDNDADSNSDAGHGGGGKDDANIRLRRR